MDVTKNKLLKSIVTTSALVILFLPAPATFSKTGRALTLEEISTNWIGISEDELSLVRLVLHEDGTGHGGYIYRGHPPQPFKISSWSYGRRFSAKIEFEKDAGNFSEILLGDVIGADMEIQISGEGWKRKVALRMEASLLDDWKKLAAATGFLFPITAPDAQAAKTE